MLKKRRKRKPVVYSRFCRMEGCGHGIIDRNRSGICTQCWQLRPEEVAAILTAEGFWDKPTYLRKKGENCE